MGGGGASSKGSIGIISTITDELSKYLDYKELKLLKEEYKAALNEYLKGNSLDEVI